MDNPRTGEYVPHMDTSIPRDETRDRIRREWMELFADGSGFEDLYEEEFDGMVGRAFVAGRESAIPDRRLIVEALLRQRLGFLWKQANDETVAEARAQADAVITAIRDDNG